MFSSWALNPYQQLLVRALRALDLDIEERPLAALASVAAAPDLAAVHIHALPFRVAADRASLRDVATVLTRLMRLRRSGTSIVWTPHDVRPHRDAAWHTVQLDRVARDLLARVASGVHVHSEYERALWRDARVPPGKLFLAPHGHYIGYYADTIGPAAARAALGLQDGDLVFGFFGWLRRNKGLLELLAAFHAFDDGAARLVVAGTPEDAAVADAVRAAQARDARIVAHLAPVPDHDVQRVLRAADVMVLPYHPSVATSGAAVLAASFGKCCIATRTGNLDSLLAAESNFLVARPDPQLLLDALRLAAKERERLAARGARNRLRAARDDWSEAATILRARYLAVR